MHLKYLLQVFSLFHLGFFINQKSLLKCENFEKQKWSMLEYFQLWTYLSIVGSFIERLASSLRTHSRRWL